MSSWSCTQHSHEKNNLSFMTSSPFPSLGAAHPLDSCIQPAATQDGKVHMAWKEQCLFFLRQNTQDRDAGPLGLYQGMGRQGMVLVQHKSPMLQVTLSYSHHSSFMPPSTGSHLCFVFPCPSAHTAPFSPPALMSFNIPDFCMVSVYTCFF